MPNITASEVLSFWFSEAVRPKHFIKDVTFDKEITDKFLKIYEHANSNNLNEWNQTAEGCLALIILLDQFPRNMFRNDSKSFDSDKIAREISKQAIDNKFDIELTKEQCAFLYLPFMHSEDLNEQELSVKLYEELGVESNLNFAIAHRDIIAKFNRFPHRNEILKRESTQEEIEFLKQPNSGF